jgi:hypothetical protein
MILEAPPDEQLPAAAVPLPVQLPEAAMVAAAPAVREATERVAATPAVREATERVTAAAPKAPDATAVPAAMRPAATAVGETVARACPVTLERVARAVLPATAAMARPAATQGRAVTRVPLSSATVAGVAVVATTIPSGYAMRIRATPTNQEPSSVPSTPPQMRPPVMVFTKGTSFSRRRTG